jgi:hypothetical protein
VVVRAELLVDVVEVGPQRLRNVELTHDVGGTLRL